MSSEPREPIRQQSKAVEQELALAISRIRFGTVVVQIQDGVVVQIESTEKRRFPSGAPRQGQPSDRVNVS